MISVGIIGASGYTGEELVKILQNHPNVVIKSLTSRTHAGKNIGDVFNLEKPINDVFKSPNIENLLECDVVFYEDKPISVELPNSVVREITYTEPAVKGDTTSGKVLKQAKISTDFELMVPLFCETGDKIEIDTRTFEYKNRVK